MGWLMEPSQLFLFLGAALMIALMPGPGILYVATRTLAGGRREGLASSFGTGIGGLVHVVAAALGLSALVLTSAALFGWLKLAGAAYLVFLGVRMLVSARADAAAMAAEMGEASAAGTRRAFVDGVLVEALNPKTAVFFLAFLPQFVDPAQGHVVGQFIVLGLISVALNTSVDVAVTLAASRVRRALAQKPGLMRRMREGSGVAMIGLGVALLFARRPSAA